MILYPNKIDIIITKIDLLSSCETPPSFLRRNFQFLRSCRAPELPLYTMVFYEIFKCYYRSFYVIRICNQYEIATK